MKAEADVAMAKNEWTTTNKKMNIADLDGVLVAFVQAAGVIVVGLSIRAPPPNILLLILE